MIPPYFVILGALISFTGGTSYVVATLKGKAKPNRVSWFLWSLAPLIAFAAEIKQGVGLASLMTFMVGFMPFLVFVSSFLNKKAAWKIQPLDIVCGALSLLGLVLWYITKVGDIAIIFSIAADGLAAVPTIVKCFYHPETEDDGVFLLGAVAAGITLLTLTSSSLAHLGFPLYIFLVDLLMGSLIRFRPGTRFLKK